MKYLFFLGNHPELAVAEIQSLLDYFGIEISLQSLSSDIYQINSSKELPKNIIDRLGGTTKISKIDDIYEKYDASDLEKLINNDEKIFGLSFYGVTIKTFEILTLSKRIKKIIKQKDRTISFIVPREGTTLSSAQITKRISGKGIEIVILHHGEKFIVAKTIGGQDIDRWSFLDYGIPCPDPGKGMLPPKLAQTMINLGLSKNYKNNIIYDPFCGNGRVMIQSTLNGFKCYSSDIDDKSVANSKANMQWLGEKFDIKDIYLENIFKYDATKPGIKDIVKEKITAIVTEPYLGKPMKIEPSNAYIEKTFGELSKIYLASLINLKTTLISGGKIVMVFPNIADQSLLSKIVDKIQNLGYHKISNFNYARSYQIVKREIVVFKLENK